jgi:hypothetical protein
LRLRSGRWGRGNGRRYGFRLSGRARGNWSHRSHRRRCRRRNLRHGSGSRGLHRCGSGGRSWRRGGRRCGRLCGDWRSRSPLPSSSCGSFLGGLFSNSVRFGRSVSFGLPLDGAAHFFSDVHRDRTRVSFLFRYAEAGQKVNDGLGLDFELAGQLVDSYLIGVGHALRSNCCTSELQTTNSFRHFSFRLR